MFHIPAHYFGRLFFPDALWSIPSKEKALYLTFDDGPEPYVTPWVLDTLKSFNAKATFFCLGKNVAAHPEIYNRILEEGHAVGNHSYHHFNGWKTSKTSYLLDIKLCAETLKEEAKIDATGKQQERNFQISESSNNQINLFRPPYGKMKFSQYSALKSEYKIIMWDVLSRDYSASVSTECCLQNVIKYSRPGSIVVLHDSLKAQKNLSYSLPRILEHFHMKGFSFNAIQR